MAESKPLNQRERMNGSAAWVVLADRQRNADGLIVCALDDMVWPLHLERELEWDRIDAGGEYTLENGQLVCPTCNKSKGADTNANARERLVRWRGMTMAMRCDARQREHRARRSTDVAYRTRKAAADRERRRRAA